MAENINEEILEEAEAAVEAAEEAVEEIPAEDITVEDEIADGADPIAGTDEDEAADAPEEEKKSGFFKKKKEDKRDEQIAELNDRVMRQMAEFENFRKRTEKEKAQMFEVGAKSIVEKILPVVDNFERGLAGTEDSDDPFTQGMLMIYKQLGTCLEEAGVTEIAAVGQPFDPELHNAVMHVDDDSYGENEIIEVFQKGYTYRDSVVRHSMVKVAN